MKALSIAYKDLQIFFKDRGSVIVLGLLPLLFVVVMSGALGSIGQTQEKDTRTPLPVVNLDGGTMAQALLDGIDKAGGVRVEAYTEAEAATALDEAHVPFVLTIPQGFTAGVDWIICEQDRTDKPTKQSITESRDYLRTIGL